MIDKQDSVQVEDGIRLTVEEKDDQLWVTLHQACGARGPVQGHYLDHNGLLVAYFPSGSGQGEIELAVSMIQYADDQGDVDKHIAVLTTDEDPHDAGVMGGEDGGG